MTLRDRVLESLVAVAAAPLFLPQCRPRPATGLTPLTAGSVSPADAAFAVEAAQSGLAELALARLAADQAQLEDTRALARRLLADHGAAQAELERIARAKRLALPGEMTAAERTERDRLADLPADAFDRETAQCLVAHHERAVALYRLQRDDGRDPELTAFAASQVATLEDHLAAARALAGQGPPKARGSRAKKPPAG